MEQIDYAAKAQTIWKGMDADERQLVRFGMFPAGKMEAADKEQAALGEVPREFSKDLACALMKCAETNGGMRV